MIYAINKQTKEHRVVSPNDENWDEEWRCAHADADGWIPWEGGECPLPDGSIVDIRYRYPEGKELHRVWPAESTDWREVVAYRPVLSEPSEPEAPRYVKVVGIDFSAYDWWTEGKQYEVIAKGGVEGVKADDGDFYPLDGGRLARADCFVPWSGEPEAPEWDGVGSPQIGHRVACNSEPEIERFMLVYIHDDMAWLRDVDTGRDLLAATDDIRPIRSEEDRAVDDALEVIGAERGDRGNVEGVVLRMIRAGYRKAAAADGDE